MEDVPVGHVSRHAPPTIGLGSSVADLGTEGSYILQDIFLDFFESLGAKRVGQDPPLACMLRLVAGVVRVSSRVHKGVVKLGLPDIGGKAVDGFESRGGVERDAIGAEADDTAWEESV